MNKCAENFLESITDVQVYESSSVSFPMPFSVGGIRDMVAPTLSNPVLSFSVREADSVVVDANITVKTSMQQVAFGVSYNHELSANVIVGLDEASNKAYALNKHNCVVVYTDVQGNRFLTYSLPGTFDISYDENISDGKYGTLKMLAKSLSGFIRLTEES